MTLRPTKASSEAAARRAREGTCRRMAGACLDTTVPVGRHPLQRTKAVHSLSTYCLQISLPPLKRTRTPLERRAENALGRVVATPLHLLRASAAAAAVRL